MKKILNKRKIKYIHGKFTHKKIKIHPFVQVKVNCKKNNEKKQKKNKCAILDYLKCKNRNKYKNDVGCFQLAVIKVPWYRKIAKSFFGFLGFAIR